MRVKISSVYLQDILMFSLERFKAVDKFRFPESQKKRGLFWSEADTHTSPLALFIKSVLRKKNIVWTQSVMSNNGASEGNNPPSI